jgi:hypothetical protein
MNGIGHDINLSFTEFGISLAITRCSLYVTKQTYFTRRSEGNELQGSFLQCFQRKLLADVMLSCRQCLRGSALSHL